jgi:hypothetical protein
VGLKLRVDGERARSDWLSTYSANWYNEVVAPAKAGLSILSCDAGRVLDERLRLLHFCTLRRCSVDECLKIALVILSNEVTTWLWKSSG